MYNLIQNLPVANIDAIPNPKNAEPICNTRISLSPYMTRINPPIKKYKIISGSLDLFYIYSQYFKRKNHFYFSKAIFLTYARHEATQNHDINWSQINSSKNTGKSHGCKGTPKYGCDFCSNLFA